MRNFRGHSREFKGRCLIDISMGFKKFQGVSEGFYGLHRLSDDSRGFQGELYRCFSQFQGGVSEGFKDVTRCFKILQDVSEGSRGVLGGC